MEGEKYKIFGQTYTHYSKAYKSPFFQPDILDLRAIKRRYWYKLFFYSKINFFFIFKQLKDS